ncbi:MAG: hypothetical protein NC548_05555 [Lachnospiraceae bacterium]|nr:hypothetical protein [Lachnospiraceae bacterium]
MAKPNQSATSSRATSESVDHPTLWVINRTTGEIRETTYQSEELYSSTSDNGEFNLPPNPTTNQVMGQYPEEVRKAYQTAMRQVVQVSRARRSPVEKIHERHKRMGMSMKDYLHYLWSLTPNDHEEKWYGELRLEKFQGRSTNSTPEETAQFISDIQRFYAELEFAGVNLCDISLDGCERNLEHLYQYLEDERAPVYTKSLRDSMEKERQKREYVRQFGFIPEHVPFFDSDFYDMDIDSITTRPQIKLSAHAKHVPLTISQCHDLSTQQTLIRTNDIVDGVSKSDASPNMHLPAKWLIGGELNRDFRQSGYGDLFYPIREDFKTSKKEYRANSSKREQQMLFPKSAVAAQSSVPKCTYQEDVIIMGRHNQTTTDPQFQKELNRMLKSETGDVPVAAKGGKKKKDKKSDKDVFGNRIDFSNKGKGKKKDDKSKKKKDKDDDERGTVDIDDSMDTSDAAKAIGQAVKSDKLRKILTKSINQSHKK